MEPEVKLMHYHDPLDGGVLFDETADLRNVSETNESVARFSSQK